MKLKKIIAVLLCAVCISQTAAGCGLSETETKTNVSTSAETESKNIDYSSLLAGVSADTSMADINGSTLSAELYCYWLSYYEKQAYTTYGADLNWDTIVDSQTATTLETYVKAEAMQTAATYILLEQKAAEYDITLTALQTQDLEEVQTADELKLETVNQDLVTYMKKIQYYHENLMAQLYAKDSDLYPTEKEIAAYTKEKNYYQVKYIWLENKDDDGNALSDTELKKVKAKAEALLAEIKDSDDTAAKFDSLMAEYNEDNSENTNGELAYSGRYTDPFEEAALELKENEISEVVEDEDYGYFIIERLPLDEEAMIEKYLAKLEDEKLNSWMQSAEAVTTDTYKNLDITAYYDKLIAYLAELDPDTYAVH